MTLYLSNYFATLKYYTTNAYLQYFLASFSSSYLLLLKITCNLLLTFTFIFFQSLQMASKPFISTHILDTTRGRPASDVEVSSKYNNASLKYLIQFILGNFIPIDQ